MIRFRTAKPDEYQGKTTPRARFCELTCKNETNKGKDKLWNPHEDDANGGVVCVHLTPEVLNDDVARTGKNISCRDARINSIAMTENGCKEHTNWNADQRYDKAEGNFKQQLMMST